MTFKELPTGSLFTRKGSPDLVWIKSEPFKAYGQFMQNASCCSPKGPWHYDKIADLEEVSLVERKEGSVYPDDYYGKVGKA